MGDYQACIQAIKGAAVPMFPAVMRLVGVRGCRGAEGAAAACNGGCSRDQRPGCDCHGSLISAGCPRPAGRHCTRGPEVHPVRGVLPLLTACMLLAAGACVVVPVNAGEGCKTFEASLCQLCMLHAPSLVALQRCCALDGCTGCIVN